MGSQTAFVRLFNAPDLQAAMTGQFSTGGLTLNMLKNNATLAAKGYKIEHGRQISAV